jgi:hypothetical protein
MPRMQRRVDPGSPGAAAPPDSDPATHRQHLSHNRHTSPDDVSIHDVLFDHSNDGRLYGKSIKTVCDANQRLFMKS